MKVFKKHNAVARLRKCLEAEKKKGPLLHPSFGYPMPRVKKILISAQKHMTRQRVYEILEEHL